MYVVVSEYNPNRLNAIEPVSNIGLDIAYANDEQRLAYVTCNAYQQ